ncbi:OmpA family protein [Gilvimarinus algae]|uniref:OmpA family protein n=1 Tax=Gilvimarinus algae TaxID=3058037 RepID=A0ABT8THT3_9GAMM|nr:OmpA family protein [Gilvimarinus sp. SDUM040014]MDO3383659.1 OmpA family protein [Gilvimarinus sp. SDUM040014]
MKKTSSMGMAVYTFVSALTLAACSSTDTAQTAEQDSSDYELVNMRTEKDVRNVNAAQGGNYSVKKDTDQQAKAEPAKPRVTPVDEQDNSAMAEAQKHFPVKESVHFAFDSAKLTPSAKVKLLGLIDDAEEHQGISLQASVDGYADATGPAAYNDTLSQKRAQSVVQYLKEQGVQVMEWQVEGHGEDNPVASNDTENGREENRRVEVNFAQVGERAEYSAR